jgi:hypothetical protein
MSFEIKKSTQFKVSELVIVTKAGPLDISKLYEEINIFDSLFLPVMSGNILINDSLGLSGKLLFDGSESILIDVSKDVDSEIGHFKKAFRIYTKPEYPDPKVKQTSMMAWRYDRDLNRPQFPSKRIRWAIGFIRAFGSPHFFNGSNKGAEND